MQRTGGYRILFGKFPVVVGHTQRYATLCNGSIDARSLACKTDIWAGLLATGSHYLPRLPKQLLLSGECGVRPRIQRRDRDGFSPSSLFFHRRLAYGHPRRAAILSFSVCFATEILLARNVEQKVKLVQSICVMQDLLIGSNRILAHRIGSYWRQSTVPAIRKHDDAFMPVLAIAGSPVHVT